MGSTIYIAWGFASEDLIPPKNKGLVAWFRKKAQPSRDMERA